MKNIILLHGAIGASDQLIPLSEELSEAGFNCYKFDFSGHGHSSFKSEFGIVTFSIELKEFILKNKLNKPDVFGYSMGGFVALLTAFHNPELIGKIITLGTKFDWSPEVAKKEVQMLDPEIITNKIPEFANSLYTMHGEKWKELLAKTAGMMKELGNKNPLDEVTFSKINNRVVIGRAENDKMVSKDETNYAAGKIKDAELFELPNSKHPLDSCNPKELSKTISQYLGL